MTRRIPRPAPAAVVLCLTPLVTLTAPIRAQRPARQQPAAAAAAAATPLDSTPWTQLRYRYIGPEGNRVASVTGVAGDPMTYYAGAASGGIFKSTDGGIHWSSIFDDQPVSSVGCGSGATSRWAGGCSSPPTPGSTGAGPASRTPDGSRRSSSTRPTPTSSTPPRRATPTGPSRSAASTAPRTAARAGSGCCSSTTAPAPPTSPWTRPTRESSGPGCGSSSSTPGAGRAAAPGAASSCPRMAAPPGSG